MRYDKLKLTLKNGHFILNDLIVICISYITCSALSFTFATHVIVTKVIEFVVIGPTPYLVEPGGGEIICSADFCIF